MVPRWAVRSEAVRAFACESLRAVCLRCSWVNTRSPTADWPVVPCSGSAPQRPRAARKRPLAAPGQHLLWSGLTPDGPVRCAAVLVACVWLPGGGGVKRLRVLPWHSYAFRVSRRYLPTNVFVAAGFWLLVFLWKSFIRRVVCEVQLATCLFTLLTVRGRPQRCLCGI